jgi:hypothetical protein
VVGGGFVGGEVGAVELDAGATYRAGSGDLDARAAPDPPQRGSRVVAENRSRATGENGSHPMSVLCEEAVPDDGVYTTVDRSEAPHLKAVIDRSASKTKL